MSKQVFDDIPAQSQPVRIGSPHYAAIQSLSLIRMTGIGFSLNATDFRFWPPADPRRELLTSGALGLHPLDSTDRAPNRLDNGRNAPIVTTIICTRQTCTSSKKIRIQNAKPLDPGLPIPHEPAKSNLAHDL
jgi:hypothetical protein